MDKSNEYTDSIPQKVKDDINKLIKIGWENHEKYELIAARGIADQILNIASKNNYPRGKMVAYYLYGLINGSLNRFDLALDNYYIGLKEVVSTDDKYAISMAYGNLGRCYGQLENNEKAIEYFNKSIEYEDSFNHHNNIGVIYLRMNQLDLAYEYIYKAFNIIQHDNDLLKNKESVFCDLGINLSYIFIAQHKPEEALPVLMNLLKIKSSKDNIDIRCALFSVLGKTYTHLGKYRLAESYHRKAINELKRYDNKEPLIRYYESYAEHFELQNNYKKAFQQNKILIETRDALFSLKITNKVLELSEHFDKELKELEAKEVEIENGKNEIANKLKQLQAIYTSVSGIGKIGIFSEKMKNIIKIADFFHLDRSVPVLIEGETGTGKEIIARMIHFSNLDKEEPFITLNCSAISSTLFESELFGYEEGAFTGANKEGRIGLFELAQNGTLFLDEIGDLPIDLQPKLLRALQQKEIFRVGGNKSILLNVRIIAATNRDLRQEIKNGNFRSDLYYRLNTGHIFIPSLMERKEEIIPLAQMFLLNFSKEKRKHFQYIESEAADVLQNFLWPGNVRELRNVIERIVLLHDDVCLKRKHLNFLTGDEQKADDYNKIRFDFSDENSTLSFLEKLIVSNVLNMFKGNISNAAKYLSTSRDRIYNRR